jgi:hypothetical protein
MIAPFTSGALATTTTSTLVETTAINGASYVTTGKGVSEHVMSGVTDQDCQLYNVIDGKAICQNYQINKIPQRDLSTKYSIEKSEKKPESIEEIISNSSSSQ